MKKFRKLFATIALTGIIVIGVTNANAGMLLSDFVQTTDTTENVNQPCSTKSDLDVKAGSDEKNNFGVIISLTGVIISLTGVIISYTGGDTERTNCGVIISRK